MKNTSLFVVFALACTFSCKAQQEDTISVMYYNILQWNDSADCNNFHSIVQYYKPDVIALCEVNNTNEATAMLNCINLTNHINYARTAFFTIGNGSIYGEDGNMFLFNKDKLTLKFQDTIHPPGERYIDRYHLYYNNIVSDTIFLDFFMAHLTPSTGSQNETLRYQEAQSFRNYLFAMADHKNIFFGGDLNLYTGDEMAYRLLLDTDSCRLNDPLNLRGNWHDNASYALIHTQDTRLAAGGMNDRFDFILTSSDVMSGTNKVKYIPGTYMALGNDGDHLNKGITDPPADMMVPSNVASSLHDKSDHLPVVLKLSVDHLFPPADEGTIEVLFQNSVENEMNVTVRTHSQTNLTFKIFNILGQCVLSNEIENAEVYSQSIVPTVNLGNGMYFLKVSDSENNHTVKKFFKQKNQ